MSDDFSTFLARTQQRCHAALPRLLGEASSEFIADDLPTLERLFTASQYSLSNGGKCIRAAMFYAASKIEISDAISIEQDTLDFIACSVEMIHAYSLIHDDLPAMDDDDLRRGRPSCHKAFDEATAILSGDALQCRAFELLVDAPGLSAEQKVTMVKILSAASGSRGMVGGQMVDISATDENMSLSQLQAMHSLKTGALMRAALALGGCAGGATKEALVALDNYGRNIGLAFQVVDDILDVEGETVQLGKTRGKDADTNKVTYVKLMGLQGARSEAQRLLGLSLGALDVFGVSAEILRELAKFIINRDH